MRDEVVLLDPLGELSKTLALIWRQRTYLLGYQVRASTPGFLYYEVPMSPYRHGSPEHNYSLSTKPRMKRHLRPWILS